MGRAHNPWSWIWKCNLGHDFTAANSRGWPCCKRCGLPQPTVDIGSERRGGET